MRILAVDDDQNMLDLLQVILPNDGHCKLVLYSSPLVALQAINERIWKFDCILLDIMMPEMDGITLCQNIRRIPRYRDTPIIMLTTRSDKKSIKSAFAAGANDFVSKPFDIYELSARIRLVDELSSARNEIRALRLRARFEKRKNKTSPSRKFGAAQNDIQCHHHQAETKIQKTTEISEGLDCANPLSRDEIVQLFSSDFSDHSYLHRGSRKKGAC